MEFEQSVEEIEQIINSTSSDDRNLLKGYIDDVIKANESNIKFGETWQELQSKIDETKLSIETVSYDEIIESSTDALSDLEKAYGHIEDNQINDKISNINKQFNEQSKILRY